MRKQYLKQAFRQLLIDNRQLRVKLEAQGFAAQETVYRWAVNNNPKLASNVAQRELRKVFDISQSIELIDEIIEPINHE